MAEAPHDAPAPRLIEVGWIVAGRLDPVDREALQSAREQILGLLRTRFPAFEWRMPVVQRKEVIQEIPVEPVFLLDHGIHERDAYRWDFALVVTGAELVSYFKPFVLGTPSKAVNVAVLSTARIDPAAFGEDDRATRVSVMSHRIVGLALHLFGHLNDLPHSEDPADFMYDLRTVSDLDGLAGFSQEDAGKLEEELAEEADPRLEETERFRDKGALFFLRAAWEHHRDILSAVFHAHPWLFPLRLSRLTTAAASTMLVLIITAEAWDLGMSQPPLFVAAISLTALAGTSTYIIKRQSLLVRRRRARPSEQRVRSNMAAVLIVLIGMATTFVLLFAATLITCLTFFSRHLVQGWAASLDGHITLPHYLVLAGFVASLGLIIGALGASFEEQHYFRHIIFVDEET